MSENKTVFMMFPLAPTEAKRLISRAVTRMPEGWAAGEELRKEVLPCR